MLSGIGLGPVAIMQTFATYLLTGEWVRGEGEGEGEGAGAGEDVGEGKGEKVRT